MDSNRQNEIAQANQKDAVVREYIKEMKGMLLDKAVADEAKTPGSGAHGVARALTLTALSQLKGDGPERRSLVFQFLKETDFPILAGGAHLSNYDLSGAILSGAILRRSNLNEANLSGTNLTSANLTGAYFYWANLRGANLNSADLSGAQLIGANLTGAFLARANLTGAELSGANLRGADLDNVIWDAKTTWPSPDRFQGATNIPPALKKQLGL